MPSLLTPVHSRITADFPGAVVAKRGPDHIHYRTPDGRMVFVGIPGGLHYWDGSAWQEVNTDWVDSNKTGYTDANQTGRRSICHVGANSERLVYPRREEPGEYWTLGRPEYQNRNKWLPLTMPGRIRSGQDLTWDAADIAFDILHMGNGVVYRITLKTSQFATSVRWPITLVGLHLDGLNVISDSTGLVVTTFRSPTMTDSTTPDPVVRLATTSVTGGYLTITPDYAGMVYPVTIE